MQKTSNLPSESGKRKNFNLIVPLNLLINLDKHSAADICKNHLKLLEKFCLDDNQFICWMCHNFNYSDEHRGHRVVSLEEAYDVIKNQSEHNLELLDRMNSLVHFRIRYTNQCRVDIETDLKKAKKKLTTYTDKIIADIHSLEERKIQELDEEHKKRDIYISQNQVALQRLSSEIKTLLNNKPDNLIGVLKQYKGAFITRMLSIFNDLGTTGFIKTLTNGIIFPSTNPVDVTLDLPKYEKIK